MRTTQHVWRAPKGWCSPLEGLDEVQLVLAFGCRGALVDGCWREDVARAWPSARVLGCSTAGEIKGVQVHDESVVVTAVSFDSTRVEGHQISIGAMGDSHCVGVRLGEGLDPVGLNHVLVLSDGLGVNGSALVDGLSSSLPPGVGLSGGLAGDGKAFEETLVFLEGPPRAGQVAVLGFYGGALKVGCASLGGWDPFGPERMITRSTGNRLYELDGRPALELYKAYLGEHASGLPATALFFPLSVRSEGREKGLVRTILGIDEGEGCMVFAGDVEEGAYARLMKANFNRLLDGAVGAAEASLSSLVGFEPELALLISCVGRRMVFKQRVEEELEVVREILGDQVTMTGFYSYGEISPFTPEARCDLHNQTMTITIFAES